MSSITPAPWQVCCDPTDGPNGSVRVLSSHGCGTVCVVDGTGDEIAANAAMIAAAPTMYSVLRSCLSRWDDLDEQDSPWLGQHMRIAIAKAEGRDE